jgi:AcrR family transcriptional regulator
MSETYESILRAARRLFDERGYSASSVREIAEASGVGKATIYHHFPDKERILLTLVERSEAEQEAMLAGLRAEPDPSLRIEAAVRLSLGFLARAGGVLQAARRETKGGRDMLRKRFVPRIQKLKGLLAEALGRGIESGAFRKTNPDKAASVLVSMVQGSFAGALLSNGRIAAPDETAKAILEIFFQGIEAR